MIRLSPIATWLASAAYKEFYINYANYSPRTLFITGLATSMAVNTLVTGMIVLRILKVTAGVKPTSIERTLGSTGGTNFRHILFVIIESGMALFAIQLVRVVLVTLTAPVVHEPFYQASSDLVVVINQALNVKSVHFYFIWFAENIYLARVSHQR